MTEPSRVTIPGVPESITRADYLALVGTLGLDARDLVELTFGWKGIYALVKARDAEGRRYSDPLERNSLAKHRIFIPVTDDPES